MISDFDTYRFYLAVKVHFTSKDFDVFNHNMVKCSEESLLKRNDNKLFYKISKKFDNPRDLIQYLVSNISVGFFDFLYDVEQATENYKKWKSYKESKTYKFKSDLSAIEYYMEKYKYDFHESAWKCYLEGKINIQSIHIIDELSNIFDKFGESTLLLHKEEILRIRKCKGFIKISETVKDILNKKLEELGVK